MNQRRPGSCMVVQTMLSGEVAIAGTPGLTDPVMSVLSMANLTSRQVLPSNVTSMCPRQPTATYCAAPAVPSEAATSHSAIDDDVKTCAKLKYVKDVDPLLLEAFQPIARDLRAAGLKAKLRMESGITTTYSLTAALDVNGERLGFVEVLHDVSQEAQVESLAEQVQNLVLEFVRIGPESVVWPRCRSGHPHPMIIERLYDWPRPQPCWQCPFDRTYRVPIGDVARLI
jgi:hypothetical protein